MALAGWVGGQFDPGLVIATSGILLLVFSTAQLFNPYLLRVADKAWLDALAAEHEAKRASASADQALMVEETPTKDILHDDATL